MLSLRKLRSLPALMAMVLAGLLLASCNDLSDIPKELRPLDSKMKALIAKNDMKETAPILLRIFKQDSKLEVWKKQTATGRFALLKTYDICAWSGDLGPKMKEGDRQAPEGFYEITPAQMNPKSAYHLSFNIGYPNAFDQSLGRTGSELMVHGACSSRGCYSMQDDQIQEIYTLARLAFQGGQRAFQVQALPFHMTPENMAQYRKNPNMPFWRMLKVGSDHFELLGQPPKVDVCSSKYVFDAEPEGGMSFTPTADCPPMVIPEPLRVAEQQKAAEDDAKITVLAAKLEEKEQNDLDKAGVTAVPTMVADVNAKVAPAAVASAAQPATAGDIQTASISPAQQAKGAQAAPAAPTPIATAYTDAPPKRSGILGFFTGLFH